MSELAIAGAAPQQKTARPPRISKRLRKVLDDFATGKVATRKAAAEAHGMNVEHVYRMMAQPHVQAFLAQRMRQTIAGAGIRAAHRLAELVDANSEHVSLDAAKHVLAIEGIKPSEDPAIVNNVNVLAGYVLDLNASVGPVIDHTQSPGAVCPQGETNEP